MGADEAAQVTDGRVEPSADLEELRAGARLAPPADGVLGRLQDLRDVFQGEQLVLVGTLQSTLSAYEHGRAILLRNFIASGR